MQNEKGCAPWPRLIAFLILHSSFVVSFSGCANSGAGVHAGEKYVVNKAQTLFYKYGPAQPAGPDFTLAKGRQVTMLSRQFGYSSVALEDGQSGYVPTDDLAPAPPEERPTPSPETKHTARRRERAPTREEESQVPLPELPQTKSGSNPPFRY